MLKEVFCLIALSAITLGCLGQEAGYEALFEAENGERMAFSKDEDGFFAATREYAGGETSVGLTEYSLGGLQCWGFPDAGCIIAKLDHCRYSEVSGSFTDLSYSCKMLNFGDDQEQTVVISSPRKIFEEEEVIALRVLFYGQSGKLERFSEFTSDGKIVRNFRLLSEHSGSSDMPSEAGTSVSKK